MIEIRLKCDECGKESVRRLYDTGSWSYQSCEPDGRVIDPRLLIFGGLPMPEDWPHTNTDLCWECEKPKQEARIQAWKLKDAQQTANRRAEMREALAAGTLGELMREFANKEAMCGCIRRHIMEVADVLEGVTS